MISQFQKSFNMDLKVALDQKTQHFFFKLIKRLTTDKASATSTVYNMAATALLFAFYIEHNFLPDSDKQKR